MFYVYLMHIPDTTYAQRHRSFLNQREEARRSLSNCQEMHGILIRACEAETRRNYLDAGAIERGTRQIVKISKLIRELSPLARQPDPPRYEPVSATLSETENRTYGGVKASRLVRVLRFIRNLNRSQNDTVVARRILKMSEKLVGGLDVYTRVKALVENLIQAIDTPATAITPRLNAKPPVRNGSLKWDVSPQKIYGWTHAYHRKGYDARQTSVYWLEKQSTALKRAIYRDYHGLRTERANNRPARQPGAVDTRTYVPPQGAQMIDQIWPPVDLVRLVEERSASTSKTCHSDQTKCEPEPRDITEHSQNKTYQVFAGSRVMSCKSQSEMHWMTSTKDKRQRYEIKPPET